MIALLLFLALVGHAFLWIGLVNRLHAVGIRRWIIKSLTLVFFLCAGLIFLGIVWLGTVPIIVSAKMGLSPLTLPIAQRVYRRMLVRSGGNASSARLLSLLFKPLPALVRFHGRRRVEINQATAIESAQHFAARLPLNEILQLEVTQWVLDVPRLPPALDGLSIVHLSDLHLTGRIGKAYFREVVPRVQ